MPAAGNFDQADPLAGSKRSRLFRRTHRRNCPPRCGSVWKSTKRRRAGRVRRRRNRRLGGECALPNAPPAAAGGDDGAPRRNGCPRITDLTEGLTRRPGPDAGAGERWPSMSENGLTERRRAPAVEQVVPRQASLFTRLAAFVSDTHPCYRCRVDDCRIRFRPHDHSRADQRSPQLRGVRKKEQLVGFYRPASGTHAGLPQRCALESLLDLLESA